jgi:hypothetical protein
MIPQAVQRSGSMLEIGTLEGGTCFSIVHTARPLDHGDDDLIISVEKGARYQTERNQVHVGGPGACAAPISRPVAAAR